MKFLLGIVVLFLAGCGDLFDGIRIGTDETVAGTSAETPLFRADFRSADFVRFPGESDSLVASENRGYGLDLAVPAYPSPLVLSLWSRDSSAGAWVLDPTSRFPAIATSRLIRIDLTDSVNYRMLELSVVGTGAASLGERIDSIRTRHVLRSPGGFATIAMRWSVGAERRVAFIDSVPMEMGRSLEVSCLTDRPSGAHASLDSSGTIVLLDGASDEKGCTLQSR